MLILFIKKETGEQKQMSGFTEAVSGGLTGADDNFSFSFEVFQSRQSCRLFIFMATDNRVFT